MRLHAVGSRGNSTHRIDVGIVPGPSAGLTSVTATSKQRPKAALREVYDGPVQRLLDRTRLMPLLQRVAEQGSVSVNVHGLTSDDIIHVPEAHTEHKKQTTAAYSVLPHIIGALFRCPTDNTLQHRLQDAVMNCRQAPLTGVYRALLEMRMLLCSGASSENPGSVQNFRTTNNPPATLSPDRQVTTSFFGPYSAGHDSLLEHDQPRAPILAPYLRMAPRDKFELCEHADQVMRPVGLSAL
jgi:hypothetical protein